MRALYLLSFMVFLGLSAGALTPAIASPTPDAAPENTVEVDVEQLDSLIETLESEEERQGFVNNLKSLRDLASRRLDEAGERSTTLIDMLGLDRHADAVGAAYTDFLEEHDLDDSQFTRWMITGGILLIVLALFLLNKKLCLKLRYKLNALKDRFGLAHERTRIYTRFLRYAGYLIILMAAAWFLSLAWGIDTTDSIIFNLIDFSRVFSLVVLILAAIIVWELIDGFIEYSLQSANRKAKARLKTLLPIARNVIMIVFLTLFSIMFLSELGVDVMPLLAGAGVIGIAIGFGAQTMVKDFITGFIIILEDLIQVGDVASLGGSSGVIERITIRKVQLRGLDGTVYTVPFGEITTIQNLTKDFSYYLLNVGVAYRENTDEVIKYMREVDEDLRADEAFKDIILEPLEVLGVDQFADSAVVIKARIKTLPIKQWSVGREYNRRMKFKFDEMGVEIPFPHQTIYFGEDKDGTAPPAHVAMAAQKSAANSKPQTTPKKPRAPRTTKS